MASNAETELFTVIEMNFQRGVMQAYHETIIENKKPKSTIPKALQNPTQPQVPLHPVGLIQRREVKNHSKIVLQKVEAPDPAAAGDSEGQITETNPRERRRQRAREIREQQAAMEAARQEAIRQEEEERRREEEERRREEEERRREEEERRREAMSEVNTRTAARMKMARSFGVENSNPTIRKLKNEARDKKK